MRPWVTPFRLLRFGSSAVMNVDRRRSFFLRSPDEDDEEDDDDVEEEEAEEEEEEEPLSRFLCFGLTSSV